MPFPEAPGLPRPYAPGLLCACAPGLPHPYTLPLRTRWCECQQEFMEEGVWLIPDVDVTGLPKGVQHDRPACDAAPMT